MSELRSHQELFTFAQVASDYVDQHPKESKLNLAITRVLRQISKIQGEYREKLEDIDIKYCETNEKGHVLRDVNKELIFTRENLLKRNEDRRAEFRRKVEFTPFYTTEYPKDLDIGLKELFTGIVIRPEEETDAVASEGEQS